MATKLIPAVAYVRKSTKQKDRETSMADQRRRIGQLQPAEAKAKYKVVRWYTKDEGVPGWKRGSKRPDYFRLVADLQKHKDAKAVLVDDMDRFSRADPMETVSDVQALRELGIRYVHAVNQGSKDLVEGGPMVAMQIAMEANASHEFSTRLSRRIAEARSGRAQQGRRSGGPAPYGLSNDGHGGLKFGDRKHVKIVRWIFDQFVKQRKSMNWIASDLNGRKVPSPRGNKWYVATVKELLKRREYKGDFSYNVKKSGQFHILNGKREVQKVSRYQDEQRKPWKATEEGRIVLEGVYRAMVEPKLFDRAQKRLASFAMKGSRRPRADGYALSGVLVCTHCGAKLYGCTHRHKRVYRCSSNAKTGAKSCKYYWVKETEILPAVLRELGKEIKDVLALLSAPPDELRWPQQERTEEREQLQQHKANLERDIKVGTRNVMLCEDARTRRDIDQHVTGMRNELTKVEAELATEEPKAAGYNREELQALADWWSTFSEKAVSVPVSGDQHPAAGLFQDPFSDEQAVLIHADVVNQTLHDLGAVVELRWDGCDLYTWTSARLTLGNRKVMLPNVPPAASAIVLPFNRAMLAKADRVFTGLAT